MVFKNTLRILICVHLVSKTSYFIDYYSFLHTLTSKNLIIFIYKIKEYECQFSILKVILSKHKGGMTSNPSLIVAYEKLQTVQD